MRGAKEAVWGEKAFQSPITFEKDVTINGALLAAPRYGEEFYVGSGSGADSTGNYGTTYAKPFATIGYALDQITASKGGIIWVLPGHAQTILTAEAIDVAGIDIIGLGSGDNRPTFTLTGQVPCFNVKSDDIRIANLRFYSATAGSSYAQNLMRIASNDIQVIGCEFKINQVMWHTLRIVSGDKVTIENCNFLNIYAPGTAGGVAGRKAQDAILNIGGTRVLVKGCRFNDIHADKSHRWKTCVEGGKLTASLDINDCDFVCRGIGTGTRSAAASGYQSTKYCRGISPSSNTSVGAIFTPTCQNILETYNVAAVNKVGLVTVTTASDLRLKTGVTYL